MKSKFFIFTSICILIFNNAFSQGTIINHTCENLSQIPMSWIDSVQAKQKWHYAHTSHGGQLTTGLNRIESSDPAYNVAKGNSTLPNVPDALCIFDGQEGDTYISPEEYWRTASGMNKTRDVLNHNPTINVSQWCWCCQLNSYSQDNTQAYLDSISVLESEFPDVTFVYMTGNAQTGPGNHYNQNLSQGYNRYQRNEQIRNYCITNNKVLFDFADIDCWWYNPSSEEWELSTYEYWNGSDTITVPYEHPQYNLNQAAHTSYENCENKGKAVWWMMSKLTGWDDGIRLNLKVFLEGPFNETEMNTDLNNSDLITLEHPYNVEPWNYSGTESVDSIPNADVVDWILIELRDTTDALLATGETIIARQAAFILNEGSVVGLDGSNGAFSIAAPPITNNLFVVIWHRNHLGIMSSNPVTETGGVFTYDFTTGNNQAYGTDAQKDLYSGVYGMIGGDANADGIINSDDGTEVWYFEAGETGYLGSDVDMDGQANNKDKNDIWVPNEGKESQVPE